MNRTKKLYDKGFKKFGLSSQRSYPNEELCRFMGRNYFKMPFHKRKNIKILEVGSGGGGNIWMISKEGFKTFGVDISDVSVRLLEKSLSKRKLKAKISVGNMTKLKFKDNTFDCIIDIFSSCLLNRKESFLFYKELGRVLKIKGKFFSYFPSKKSTMFKFKNKKAVYKLDNTLMRFLNKNEYIKILSDYNLKTYYSEELTKTYFNGKAKFTFLVLESKNLNQHLNNCKQ